MFRNSVCLVIFTVATWAQTAAPPIAATAPSLSAMAGTVLENAGQARLAIGQQNLPAARQNVGAARAIARKLRDRSGAAARPLLVPMTVEVEQVTTYEPAETVRRDGVEKTRSTDQNRARRTERTSEHAALDLTLVSDRLDKANNALERGDMAEADLQLADVETAVVRQPGNSELPMLKARENLMQARSRILESRYREAAAPLGDAARALDTYLAGPSPPSAGQVDVLRRKILDMSRNVKSRPAHAADDINVWIEQVTAWDPGAQR